MKRSLVTGGAGFIGANLVRKLVSKGHEVLVVDSLTYAGNLKSLDGMEGPGNHSFLKADIADQSAMTRAIQNFQPDCIFHLAAETHVDRSIEAPMDFLRSNVIGTGSLLQAALDYWSKLSEGDRVGFRFIHVSTDEVFGSCEEGESFSETSPYSPRSPYAASKAASDQLVRAWGVTYGLPVIVTNCSNNYGPYQFPEKLIPLAISYSLQEMPVPVYGRGLQIRDWIHVEDHCAALMLVADIGKAGETYTIGGGDELRNVDLVEKLCDIIHELTGKLPEYEFVADRPGHDFRYSIESGKIRNELGWAPRHGFEKGLKETVRWYLEHRDWWSRGSCSQAAERRTIS